MSKRRETGSLVVILPLLGALVAGVLIMGNWTKPYQITSRFNQAEIDAKFHAGALFSRIRSSLVSGPFLNSETECQEVAVFRNLAQSVPPVRFDWRGENIPETWCGMSINRNVIDHLVIEITRMGEPDLVALSSTVGVAVTVTLKNKDSKGKITGPVASHRLERRLLMRAAALKDFSFVLKRSHVTDPGRITLSDLQSSLRVTGMSYFDGGADGEFTFDYLNPDLFRNERPRIVFERALSRSKLRDAGTETQNRFEFDRFRKVFPRGLETGVLKNTILPYHQSGPAVAGASFGSPLNVQFDYTHRASAPTPFLYPVPNLSGWRAHPAPGNNHLNFDIQRARNAWRIPRSHDPAIPNLDDTCTSSAMLAPIAPLVMNSEANSDIVLDMSQLPEGRRIFCGLINADRLVVRTGQGAYQLFGTYLVNQLVIEGPGQVTITAPRYIEAGDLWTQSGRSIGEAHALFNRTAAYHGNPYFRPLYQGVPASKLYAAVPPWLQEGPNGINVGYFDRCAGEANNSVHFCPIPNRGTPDYRNMSAPQWAMVVYFVETTI